MNATTRNEARKLVSELTMVMYTEHATTTEGIKHFGEKTTKKLDQLRELLGMERL